MTIFYDLIAYVEPFLDSFEMFEIEWENDQDSAYYTRKCKFIHFCITSRIDLF